MRQPYKHLSYVSRLKIESLRRAGVTISKVAEIIGCDQSTIYRELKRGTYVHLNSDYTEEKRYSPELAQQRYDDLTSKRGRPLKLGNDYEFAHYIEKRIGVDKLSPCAVIAELNVHNPFKTHITKQTLYKYIDKGIFLTISNKNLPIKGRKSRKPITKRQKRANAGTSIERRPKDIDARSEFGHWEMDTVVGKKGESTHSLLVLTERKTRYELVRLLYQHTAAAVVDALNTLERKYGDDFKRLFKTVTVDNGSEFADVKGMEKSFYSEDKRFPVYYCHAYRSSERGSNENQNRLVRRHLPKGINFDDKTDDDIQIIEDWINDYPREMFNGHTARERYQAEVAAIGG